MLSVTLGKPSWWDQHGQHQFFNAQVAPQLHSLQDSDPSACLKRLSVKQAVPLGTGLLTSFLSQVFPRTSPLPFKTASSARETKSFTGPQAPLQHGYGLTLLLNFHFPTKRTIRFLLSHPQKFPYSFKTLKMPLDWEVPTHHASPQETEAGGQRVQSQPRPDREAVTQRNTMILKGELSVVLH